MFYNKNVQPGRGPDKFLEFKAGFKKIHFHKVLLSLAVDSQVKKGPNSVPFL